MPGWALSHHVVQVKNHRLTVRAIASLNNRAHSRENLPNIQVSGVQAFDVKT